MRRCPLVLSVVLFPLVVGAQLPAPKADLTLGCESCGGALQFGNIWEVAVSDRGEVLVVDRDAPMLRFFDASGKPGWQAGTKGRGPGEYQLVVRAGLSPGGGAVILDMLTQRVTELGADHRVKSTTPVMHFPTTAGADAAGNMVLGAEGPMGTFEVLRWHGGALTPVAFPKPEKSDAGPAVRSASIALAPNGVVAVLPHSERYRIIRVDAAGARLPDLQRTIERVRNSPEEEEILRARIARGARMTAAELNRSGKGGSAAPVPVIPESERTLKPHVAVDGLRYDGTGRLWVRTMRGDASHTVFDVFAGSGAFAGSVTVPQKVEAFALGGPYLVTAGENADGIPQVTRWVVR